MALYNLNYFNRTVFVYFKNKLKSRLKVVSNN